MHRFARYGRNPGGLPMRTILAATAFTLAALSGTANAQMLTNRTTGELLSGLTQSRMEVLAGPLGLERAIDVNGMKCTMTTPYDKWAKCGMDRITLMYCSHPAFDNGRLVCGEPSPKKQPAQ